MTNVQNGGRPLSPPAAPPGDPLLTERLARLSARSTAHRAGTSPTGSGAGTRPASGSTPTPSAAAATGARSGKRRHAAKGSRVAALTMSLLSTAGLTAFFAHADSALASDSTGDGSTAGAPAAATPVTVAATPAPTVAAAVAETPAAPAAPETTAAATTAAPETTAAPVGAGYTDGVYVGAADRNRWGTVQVQVTVSGGSITDVTTLQSPDGDRKSVRINERALPTLASQAVSAQSSRINGVSGATYTTNSYISSLQSALDQA